MRQRVDSLQPALKRPTTVSIRAFALRFGENTGDRPESLLRWARLR